MVYRISLFLTIVIILLASTFALTALVSQPHLAPTTKNSTEQTLTPPLGLPPIPWPADNPYSKEKAELGRLLYFDKRLSADGTVSCATCHHRSCGYGDCRSVAIGIKNHKGTRHSPTVINTAYAKHLFWDGRASSLEEQCKGPIGNPKEMALLDDPHEAHRQCATRIQNIAGYRTLFKEVFGTDTITIDEISRAIATFERTILSGNSPFDRYHAGDHSALTQEQVHGMKLFKKVGCVNCHTGFNFSNDQFFNIGVGMDLPNPDTGRYAITHQVQDWGAFKVPTLRDTEHAAPYMHDGSLATLEEVIDFYDKGGIPNKNLHSLMRPLHLSDEDKKALVSFLKSLNGEGWQSFKEPDQFPL